MRILYHTFKLYQNRVVYDLAYNGINNSAFAPYEINLTAGKWKIECWGASGNSSIGYDYGLGSYTSGILSLERNLTLYVHVGAKGWQPQPQAAYGGGGPGQVGGGGATDVRLNPGPYFDEDGLKSRIMVAAGGGGYDYEFSGTPAGSGGGLKGFDGDGKGGNQTSGGDGLYKGFFGLGGGNGERVHAYGTPDGNAGGGGGYFGGGTSNIIAGGSAGGGSSYISGYPGCISVDKDYTQNNPKFSTAEDPSIHYSGIKFENPVIIDGKSPMPIPNLNKSIPEFGHLGNGHVIISTAEKYDYPYFSRITAIPYKVKCSIPLKVGRNFDIFFTLSIVYLSLG